MFIHKKKNIVILGSSGSIGESALDVVRQFKDRFTVLGLCVNTNVERLKKQIAEFKPEYVAVRDGTKAKGLGALARKTKVLTSLDGVCKLASLPEEDIILLAIVGAEAICPLLSAIRARRPVALANKEAVVMAGDIALAEAKRNNVRIIPVDSEQNAIFQCLEGYGTAMVERIYLTASGGPLADYPCQDLKRVSLKKVLAHPRWKMGKKITVDSATMMNKGLEVIETRQLFDLELEKINVLIHRQALIHSMVEFTDGSILAQMAVTDMRLPIQYALSYPERWPNERLRLDPLRMGALTFTKPDCARFPCLALAFEAARLGGAAPCALNAANEVAVEAFLEGRLAFGGIPRVIERIIKEENFPKKNATLTSIFDTDRIARSRAQALIGLHGKRGIKR